MTQIHGKMTIDKVDETMDQLREQHQLSEEIAQAITSGSIGEQPDETELDRELEGLEQEAMDERMLKTGTVPVADQINMLPSAAKGELTTGKQPAQEEDEEAELEKLRAEMAMG
jgi:charged multivesicular body protein 4